jgi:hypothetical protein
VAEELEDAPVRLRRNQNEALTPRLGRHDRALARRLCSLWEYSVAVVLTGAGADREEGCSVPDFSGPWAHNGAAFDFAPRLRVSVLARSSTYPRTDSFL